jgi:hypothetical protein
MRDPYGESEYEHTGRLVLLTAHTRASRALRVFLFLVVWTLIVLMALVAGELPVDR